ncbi:MAG TPA: IclR family transcriptional regulator C-terminal domain-containing protein [Holophagaceae bacterium]|nr:IclR family transcriptional regulator C-terminal domain-containing protein [Holophagaceae bacterium]
MNPNLPFEESPDFVQSLARGLDVLRAFDRENPSMSLSEVSERTGLARAAARRSLLTLGHLGYVGQKGRQFFLTARVLELGFGYLSSLNLPELAMPWMEQLAHRVNESTSLSVLDGQDIVYVARVPVRRVMTIALGVGARLPAFAASMGRVLLAGLDPEALDAWFAKATFYPLTSHTITDPRRLREEILRTRDQGYGLVVQELELGLCSLSVPIRDRQGKVVAALNVGMQFHEGIKAHALKDVLPALRETQAAIEGATAHHWASLGA